MVSLSMSLNPFIQSLVKKTGKPGYEIEACLVKARSICAKEGNANNRTAVITKVKRLCGLDESVSLDEYARYGQAQWQELETQLIRHNADHIAAEIKGDGVRITYDGAIGNGNVQELIDYLKNLNPVAEDSADLWNKISTFEIEESVSKPKSSSKSKPLKPIYYKTRLAEVNNMAKLKAINEMSWLPRPFVSNLEWAVADALVNNPELQRNIPERTILTLHVEPTQARLDRETVDKYAASGNTTGGLAFERNNTVHLYDGHHRYYAALKNVEPYTKLKLFHMNDTDGSIEQAHTLEDFADRLGVRKASILKAMSTDDRRFFEDNN